MKNKSTNQNNGLWTASYGEIGATLKALQDNGVTLEHLAKLRTDSEYAKRVAEYILHSGKEYSKRIKSAMALMGKNFFGIEDWATFYGVAFSQEQLWRIPEFPWSKDILNKPCPFNKGQLIKDTHFAFLGISSINGSPLTVDRWFDLYSLENKPEIFCSVINNDSDPWNYGYQLYNNEVTLQPRWYLSLKNVVSGHGTYRKRVATLPRDYEVSSTIAEVTKAILFFCNTGKFLNGSRTAICAERTEKTMKITNGFFSAVEYYDDDCISLSAWDDQSPSDDTGLAVLRKPGA